MAVESSEIASSLSIFGIECSQTTLEQLAQLANSMCLTLDRISEEYLAYRMSLDVAFAASDKHDSFGDFSAQLVKNFGVKKEESVLATDNSKSLNNSYSLPTPSFSFFDSNTKGQTELTAGMNPSIHDELASVYGYTPARVKQYPMNIFSPASLYPLKTTTVNDVNSASGNSELNSVNKNQVMDSYFNGNFTDSNYQIKNITYTKPHMTEKVGSFPENIANPSSAALYINRRIEQLSDLIRQNNKLKDFEQFHPIYLPNTTTGDTTSQSSKTVYIRGRICKNITSSEHLNFENLMLEGCLSISNGKRVFLRVSANLSCSLFLGQVVIARGHFDSEEPNVFYTTDLYYNTELPNKESESVEASGDIGRIEPRLNVAVLNEQVSIEKRINIVAASGPFLQIEDIDTEFDQTHLIRLFEFIKNNNIKLIVLIGPFFKFKCSQICNQFELMRQFTNFIDTHCRLLNVISLMVPSIDDINATPFYPIHTINQKFTLAQSLKSPESGVNYCYWACSPCTINIEGVELVVTSQDILMHLGANELNSIAPSIKIDRISRLLQHIIDQQNLYPLYPAYKTVNINLADSRLKLTRKPDFIILPSDLRHFIKNIKDVVVVNPGKCLKGKSFGFLSRFSIVLDSNNKIDTDRSQVQVLSI